MFCVRLQILVCPLFFHNLMIVLLSSMTQRLLVSSVILLCFDAWNYKCQTEMGTLSGVPHSMMGALGGIVG
jgi:hypothetical protein